MGLTMATLLQGVWGQERYCLGRRMEFEKGLLWSIAGFASGVSFVGGNVQDEMLDALVAELHAIELWDVGETSLPDGEIEARRIRRLEILGEIALSKRQIELLKRC